MLEKKAREVTGPEFAQDFVQYPLSPQRGTVCLVFEKVLSNSLFRHTLFP